MSFKEWIDCNGKITRIQSSTWSWYSLAREGKWLSLLSIRNCPRRYLHVASTKLWRRRIWDAGMRNSMAHLSLCTRLFFPIFKLIFLKWYFMVPGWLLGLRRVQLQTCNVKFSYWKFKAPTAGTWIPWITMNDDVSILTPPKYPGADWDCSKFQGRSFIPRSRPLFILFFNRISDISVLEICVQVSHIESDTFSWWTKTPPIPRSFQSLACWIWRGLSQGINRSD